MADTGVSGAVTGVFEDIIPPTSLYPAARFVWESSPPDTIGNSAQRILTSPRYLVVAVDQAQSYAGILPVADAIDDALTDRTHAVQSGGTYILGVYRLYPSKLQYEFQGLQFRQLGGLYQIVTCAV
jgi:hypothetical protein